MSNLPAILGGAPVRPQGPPDWPLADPQVQDVLSHAAANGSWGRYHGPHCEALIERLQQLHGVAHVLLTCSGTAAVELALRGIGVTEGDEVIQAAYDFKANFTNIVLLEAKPVLVDIQSSDGQFDLNLMEQAVTKKTRGILVSHLHGACVNMPDLMKWAQAKGLSVVEDACQMPGADIYGRPAGTWGDVGVISFGGSKTLTAGRGGAIVTHRDDIAQRIRLYTQRGNDAYPLSELQAALLVPQLRRLAERQTLRAATAQSLRERLVNHSCLKPFKPLPQVQPDYYKLGFWFHAGAAGLTREDFCNAMRAEGIPVDPSFRSLHLIHARSRFRTVQDLPVATRADHEVVVLHHPFLLEGDQGVNEFMEALDKLLIHATLLQDSRMPP